MKLKTMTTAEACRSVPSARMRWCTHCRRNEHHRCTGSRRCNHGVTQPCLCPHSNHSIDQRSRWLGISQLLPFCPHRL